MLLIALIQGIIEGLTEFLPISSTGHLILSGHLLGFTDERAKTFEIIIQLAAILAAVWVFRQRFIGLLPFKRSSKNFSGWSGLKLLAITTLPAVIAGYLLIDVIKDYLFTPLTVAIGLAVGGLVLIWFENFTPKPRSRSLDELSPKQALGIGLAQVLSIWPGVSRAASTIVGGSFLGLNRRTAVEYSFFAAVPVMLGATILDLAKNFDVLKPADLPLFAVGMVTSFVTAMLAIKFFLKLVEKYSLRMFGYYRLALATVILLVLVA